MNSPMDESAVSALPKLDGGTSYHDTVQDVYRKAAEEIDDALCCVAQTPKYLPGLKIPNVMYEMNYGCGTTIHLQDMADGQQVVYIGVGGGLEALQLAYFCRQAGAVIAVDPVAEMREVARRNLLTAARMNDWFDPSFVEIRDGNALSLPLASESVHVAAQNCLFNIFKTVDEGGDLERALAEVHRVLKPRGRLVMSDPIATRPIPVHLRDDEVLRAQCISGCLTYARYMDQIVEAGFGAVEVRSRRPYRMLDQVRYQLDRNLLLETVEVGAFKVPVLDDGPCIFTGRTAIYTGPDASFDDSQGHVLERDLPLPVCDKTAALLSALDHPHLTITAPTWHYAGGGCC